MKKTTILAASVVLAIAISAVWFSRERSGTQQTESRVIDPTESSPPSNGEVTPEPNEIEQTLAGVEVVPAAPARQVANTDTVVRLFTELSETSIETLDASVKGQVHMNGFLPDYYVDQGRTVQINEANLRRLESIAMVDPGGLNETFDLTIFPDRPCTFSSLRNVSKRDDGSVSIIYAQCDNIETSHNASISFNARNGVVTLLYNDRDRYYQVVSVGGGFAVALSLKPSTNNPLTGR